MLCFLSGYHMVVSVGGSLPANSVRMTNRSVAKKANRAVWTATTPVYHSHNNYEQHVFMRRILRWDSCLKLGAKLTDLDRAESRHTSSILVIRCRIADHYPIVKGGVPILYIRSILKRGAIGKNYDLWCIATLGSSRRKVS